MIKYLIKGLKVISKKTIKSSHSLIPGKVQCIGCGALEDAINCNTGSILGGECNSARVTREGGEMIGVIDTYDSSHVIRTEEVTRIHRFRFHKRIKGQICSRCASDYRTVNGQPRVKTDSQIIGKLAVPEIERRMDSTPEKSSPTSPRSESPALNDILKAKSHWLDVGRR
jgi:hypothetical protein